MAKDRGGMFGIFASGIVALACFTYVFSDHDKKLDVDTDETAAHRAPQPAAAEPPPVAAEPAPAAEPPPVVAAPEPAPAEPIAVPAPEPTPVPATECDEVSCVLDEYQGACCAKYRKDRGYLQVYSTPEARVFVDDVDTQLTTPTRRDELPLAPGKHRVTLQVGQDRFTFSVKIKAGQTERLMKDLR